RLADEDEEGCLKRILGIVRVPQDTPAHPEYHRAVPLDQDLKGGFLTPGQEGLQELAVRQSGRVVQESEPAKMLEDAVRLAGSHRRGSLGGNLRVPTDILLGMGQTHSTFFGSSAAASATTLLMARW